MGGLRGGEVEVGWEVWEEVSKLTFFIKKIVKCTAIDIRNAKLVRFLRKRSVFHDKYSKVALNWHFEY